jgi:dimethylargininase
VELCLKTLIRPNVEPAKDIWMSMMQVEIAEVGATIRALPGVAHRSPQEFAFKAITRGVSRNMGACELTYRSREAIDPVKASFQLERYGEVLRKWGVDLVTLPASESHPDCCFVQDTAFVLDEVCIMASMGAAARRGEVSEVERHLSQFRQIRHIVPPATLDGGDVIQVGKRLFVGLSTRTNARGIDAFTRIVETFGYTVTAVSVTGGLHLTTGCGVVDDETVILNPRWVDALAFRNLRQLHVPEDEPWAANTIRVDDALAIEDEAPRTIDLVQPYARSIDTLNISEFRKAEGSLSCLSLIFREPLQEEDEERTLGGIGDGKFD